METLIGEFKTHFNLLRLQTAVVHLRVALQFTEGNLQEFFNMRVFIIENWRGIFIPYFDAVSSELSLISIKERGQ